MYFLQSSTAGKKSFAIALQYSNIFMESSFEFSGISYMVLVFVGCGMIAKAAKTTITTNFMSFGHVISHMTFRVWQKLTPHGRNLFGTGARHWGTGLGFHRSVARKTTGLSIAIRNRSDPCTTHPYRNSFPNYQSEDRFSIPLEGGKVNDAPVTIHLFLVRYFWLSAHNYTNGSRPWCQIKVTRP